MGKKNKKSSHETARLVIQCMIALGTLLTGLASIIQALKR